MNKLNWLKKSRITDNSSLLFKVLKIFIYSMDLFCALLFIFYIVGNYQNFEDESQQIILSALSYASILNCLLAIPAFLEAVFMLFSKSTIKKGFSSLIGMILTLIFCIFIIVISGMLTFLSAGI